jgi:hypothetical protein
VVPVADPHHFENEDYQDQGEESFETQPNSERSRTITTTDGLVDWLYADLFYKPVCDIVQEKTA